ncbi:hypothetical protein NVP1020O_14 [Vibrio phage 1.020.O._10N.222.48.A2]|uniref:Uncharacterized protein n=1 Tax=Vibrio phage 1.020.O._10N.222.48.A2 TaxID=1881450 RepID=A0A2I7QKY0_9VIRU|nr:hypothetical protein KMD66_gp14 [Vibrio phage 1.020.O._10N.222.48.A2]AUR82056.1 hypothetical protein NVP1020O_14 [Vibrio phage 1.020.O._10N.222.48.A2]
MPFLLPIAVLGGTGIFAWKAGDAAGNAVETAAKVAAVGGVLYLIYKSKG